MLCSNFNVRFGSAAAPVLSKPAAFSAPRIRCCNFGGIAAYELSPSPKAAHHRVGSTETVGTLVIEGGCEVPTGG